MKVGEAAQWVKGLWKHEDLRLDPQHPHKKLGTVVHSSNSSTAKGGEGQVPGHSDSQPSFDSLSQTSGSVRLPQERKKSFRSGS